MNVFNIVGKLSLNDWSGVKNVGLLLMIFLLIRTSIIRSHRLSVRTVGFHPTKEGSIPLGTPPKSQLLDIRLN